MGSRSVDVRNFSGWGESTTDTKETTHYTEKTTLPDGSIATIDVAQEPQRAKTLWDWLQLLIVPTALAVGGLLFTRYQREREQEAEERQKEREQAVEDQRAQDTALQTYLSQMSQLLLDAKQPLYRAQAGDYLSTVARAQTLTILGNLDGDRKRSVLQFLYEARLINNSRLVVFMGGANLRAAKLNFASLSDTNLSGADLSDAVLGGAILSTIALGGATLRSANLNGADLRQSVLGFAELSSANLIFANLAEADLSFANLSGASLSYATLSSAILVFATLIGANLGGADLSGADLSSADLSGADLSGANLTNAIVSNEQLTTVRSLEGATMPEG